MKKIPSTIAWTPDLQQWLREQALEAGFDTAGVAPVDKSDAENLDAERFAAWVAAGRAGEMDYLKRRDDPESSSAAPCRSRCPGRVPSSSAPSTTTPPRPRSIDPAPPNTGWIARYAWSGQAPTPDTNPEGKSRHDSSPPTTTTNSSPASIISKPPSKTASPARPAATSTPARSSSAPIAANAGIGWIGKNTCILNQQLGSWLLLAVIVTSIPVAPDAPLQIAADRCGTCTRCIDACPTDALVAPHQMDASRCISYLTIEKKGAIPDRTPRTHGPPGLRLRHLPGGLPLEQEISQSPRAKECSPGPR